MSDKRDRIYSADNARFTIKGMDITGVPEADRDRDLRWLLDLLDEFYAHGVTPKCESGMLRHYYSFGSIYDFIFASAAELKALGISRSLMQRMQTSLMAKPSILREIDTAVWNGLPGFKNDCGYASCDAGRHYSGNRPTWHSNREHHYRHHNDEIDWTGRVGEIKKEFIPNRVRTDELLRLGIDRHVRALVDEEATREKWTQEERQARFDSRVEEIKRPWRGESPEITFHREVMNHKGGTISAKAVDFGGMICEANFYVFEQDLTAAETEAAGGSMRRIYSLTGHDGKKQYISIDCKHGMFEFHDHRGNHLGEYRFNGEFNSGADPSHNLKTL
ncbi:MAG: hypothetical protein K2O24_04700 [Muribaculaceae bacterium]|nr:hypothetical protein [Muribaculaceae bacterium]